MTQTNPRKSFAAWLGLAAMALLWAIPLIWTIAVALRPTNVPISVGSSWFGGRLTLDSIIAAWNAAPFRTYYVNTVTVVLGILAVQIITVTLAGFVFARLPFPGRQGAGQPVDAAFGPGTGGQCWCTTPRAL